jgi:hypothetical protein
LASSAAHPVGRGRARKHTNKGKKTHGVVLKDLCIAVPSVSRKSRECLEAPAGPFQSLPFRKRAMRMPSRQDGESFPNLAIKAGKTYKELVCLIRRARKMGYYSPYGDE